MKSSYSFEQFCGMVIQFEKELHETNPEHSSQEWYLLNHVRKLANNCKCSSSAIEVSNSVKALMRFCIDSIEWNTPLSDTAQAILDYHGKLLQASK